MSESSRLHSSTRAALNLLIRAIPEETGCFDTIWLDTSDG